jgi:serine/threonine protein phosphatase PrpC
VAAAIGVQLAALSDVGMRRTTNQDSHATIAADTAELLMQRGHLLMVTDGMGAHAAGELASKIAAEGIPHLYLKYAELSPPEALLRAIRETNTEINRRGSASTDFHNMGTTCSVLVLLPQGAIAAHVGDSRIYRLRQDTISQLTFDHSLQWELKASGQLPEGSDLAAVVPKNVITRSLGPNANVMIDLEGPHPLAEGDVFLLCSDGLTGRVEDAELGAVLASLPPAEAAQALVDLANLRGGPDNVTVLIGRVKGPELADQTTVREPLRMGGSHQMRPVYIAIWMVAVVCLLSAGVLLGLAHKYAAAAALGGALVTALVAVIYRQTVISGRAVGGSHMLGKGPYVSVPCQPSHELAQKLASTLDELREAAREGEWSIQWQPLDDSCRAAVVADRSGNFAEAVRQYCRAISYMMNELRLQNVKKASDSTVRY